MQTAATSITGSIRIRSLQRAIERRRAEEREAHLSAFCNTETRRMPVTAPMRRVTPVTRPMLPLDVHGRPYVQSVGVPGETLDLIKEAVARFYSIQQAYPSIILLSPFRFLLLGGRATHYKINGNYISIMFDEATYVESRFDVMVRGDK